MPIQTAGVSGGVNSRSSSLAVVVATVLAVAVLGALVDRASASCSRWVSDGNADDEEDGFQQPSYAETLLHAEVVVYGRVRRKYEDHPGALDYTAEMDVYCTLKGQRTASTVNISDAGYIPTRCFSTTLQVGTEYLVVASSFGVSGLRAAEDEIVATADNLYNATRACHLRVQYPFGVDAGSARVRCPTPARPGQCLDVQDFTTTTTIPTTTTTEDFDDYDDAEGDYDDLPSEIDVSAMPSRTHRTSEDIYPDTPTSTASSTTTSCGRIANQIVEIVVVVALIVVAAASSSCD